MTTHGCYTVLRMLTTYFLVRTKLRNRKSSGIYSNYQVIQSTGLLELLLYAVSLTVLIS